MKFFQHKELIGKHAFLSPSKHSWTNYDVAKLVDSYHKFLAVEHGTRLHNFACECIRLGQKLPKSKKTLNAYVNDAIGFRMTPEQTLYFSDNCFGTADAISYRDKTLRIFDLKTGVSPTSMRQLEIYAALFFLEYEHGIIPDGTTVELRIYQNNVVTQHFPDFDVLYRIMETIKVFDKEIDNIKKE